MLFNVLSLSLVCLCQVTNEREQWLTFFFNTYTNVLPNQALHILHTYDDFSHKARVLPAFNYFSVHWTRSPHIQNLSVLVHLGCDNRQPTNQINKQKTVTGRFIKKQNLFLRVLEVESPRSGRQHGLMSGIFQVTDSSLYSHMVRRAGDLFYRALIPFMTSPLHDLITSQRPRLLTVLRLIIRIPTCEF